MRSALRATAEGTKVMAMLARTAVAVAVLVVPGAFLALVAFACARAVVAKYQLAAQGENIRGTDALWTSVRALRFSDIVREARAVV